MQALRLGLAKHEVYVFGHEDVSEKKKLMAAADDFEDVEEYPSRVIVGEIG